jgi:hypothetical protein
MDEFKIDLFKYDGAGVMVSTADKHKRIYADTDFWVRKSDIEELNKEVMDAERKQTN